MKKVLAGLSSKELKELLSDLDMPSFRINQIHEWVNKGKDISEMANIPKTLRAQLEENFTSKALEIEKIFQEESTSTTKLLLKTMDDILIECVILTYSDGISLCVSTQAGCRMGCTFCMSGKDGLIRNLTWQEMASEVLLVMDLTGMMVSNIVLMGSGEPFDNYDEVIHFIKFLTQEDSLNMSPRRITISTCGVIPGIEKLEKEDIPVNLSISLHCAVNEIRKDMMPVEKAYPIDDVIKEAHRYRQISKRRLTLEYCVVGGTNDSDQCAKRLKKLIGTSDDLVNLIDVNEGRIEYTTNGKDVVKEFAKKLSKESVEFTIRRKLGSQINAACGQLKASYLNKLTKEE